MATSKSLSTAQRSASAGSSLQFGVRETNPLDFSVSGEAITTKVYHGVTIAVGSNIIGRVQSWQPDAHTREGVHLYELADTSWGRPVDYVPGRNTGYTIAVTRAEVWDGEMEIAFGLVQNSKQLFIDLIDQNRHFNIKEFWIRGNALKQTWTYRGCWFQSKNYDAISADGDGVTRISANIAYTARVLS